MRRLLLAALILSATTMVAATSAIADIKITDRPYVRHDGGTDITILSCSSDATDPAADAPTPTPPADEAR